MHKLETTSIQFRNLIEQLKLMKHDRDRLISNANEKQNAQQSSKPAAVAPNRLPANK